MAQMETTSGSKLPDPLCLYMIQICGSAGINVWNSEYFLKFFHNVSTILSILQIVITDPHPVWYLTILTPSHR